MLQVPAGFAGGVWPTAGVRRPPFAPSVCRVFATHSLAGVAMDTLPAPGPRILFTSVKIIGCNQRRRGVCSYHTHPHRYTRSCNHLLCAMVSVSEQASLLVRHSGVSASGDGYKRGFLQLCLTRPPPAAWNNVLLPQHDI